MLSSSPIKNVNQASHYYSEKDNYYTRDEGMQLSEWWGKGAQTLQLQGRVDEKQFTELLQGKLPNGERLGIMMEGELKHRAGWDLTFSAPKSVSMMAYIGGDTRLLEAHRESLHVVLSHIERHCAEVRLKENGEMVYRKTNNLVAALYPHDLSREHDPQMHTHAVVMNMTERSDQQWRSLASHIGRYDENTTADVHGFIERVRHHNRFFAKIYETELAYRVKQLGYDITTDTPSGKFEIVGIDQKAIQAFSKRREQIEQALQEKGFSGGKAAEIATLATRQQKTEVNRTELKKQWERQAETLGLDCQKLVQATYQKENINENTQKIHANDHLVFDLLEKSAKALSVFQTIFTLDDIMLEASDHAMHQNIDVDTLLKGIDSQVVKGELISVEGAHGKTLFMAKSTLEEEKRLSAHLQDNTRLKPSVKDGLIHQYVAEHKDIPISYLEPLQTILGQDRVVLIEGNDAKEAFVEPVMDIAKSAGCEVMILSPTLVGSKHFAKELGAAKTFWEKIKSYFVDITPKHESVMQFLARFHDDSSLPSINPDIVIVDNAHLLSTHQKVNLIEWNTKHQSKLILLGNKDTLLPQQRGASIEKLLEAGMKSISLPPKDPKVFASTIAELFDKTADRIMEVPHLDDRYYAMAAQFVRLPVQQRRQSWLIAPTKQPVEALNSLTHQKMVEEHHIKAIQKLHVLIPVYLEEGKAQLATQYKKNQMVRFNETYKSLAIQRGEYCRVIQTHEKSNRVVLKKSNGKEIVWDPFKIGGKSGKVELFDEKEREFGIGESVIFHRSMKSKHIAKGERLTVEKLSKRYMTLCNHEGKKVIIDMTKPYHRHMDYGYAATPHDIAHEKPTTIIADLPASSYQTDQRRFQQIIAQPKEAWIYTDDHQQLVVKLQKNDGNRLTAHETLKKFDDLKKNFHAMFHMLETKMMEKEGTQPMVAVKKAINAMDYAMRHLSEREAGFSHKDLMQIAMKHAVGEASVEQLTKVVLQMEKSGMLQRGMKHDETLWTTVDAVKMEREIVSLSLKDQGKFEPIASDEMITTYCNPAELKDEQIHAIKTIVQSKDRVLSIQGRAGTGKTTMMLSLQDVLSAKEVLGDHGYKLQGIAPTHKAVKELKVRGISTQTVDSFLLEMKKLEDNKTQHDFSKTLLIVDEASMISNRKMRDVLITVHDFNFRGMVSTGDREQNPAIEAGKPHDLMQNALETTLLLKEIQRQKNPILKKAVKAIYEGNVKKTFSILDKSIIEINEKTVIDPEDKTLKPPELYNKYYPKRVEAIVKDYLYLFTKGEQVQIIAPSHKDRKAINQEVRLQLNQLGIMKGEDSSFSILTSKNMSGVERTEALNFTSGQVVRFNISSGKRIKAGDYLTIQNVNKSHNMLTLTKDGKEILWQVPRSSERINHTIEVFEQESRLLRIGDKIAWTRTDKKEGHLTTDFAEVMGIDQQRITVKRSDQSLFTFHGDDKKYQHWDHGYAITVYSAQGGTYGTVLALFETVHKKLINFKNFLVTITRPEHQLRIYTNDKEESMKAIASNKGDKLSSLEVIGEYPQKQKPLMYSNKNKNSDKRLNLPHSDRIQEVINQDRKVGSIVNRPIENRMDSQKISDHAIKHVIQKEMKNIQRHEAKYIESYQSISTLEPSKDVSKTIQNVKTLEHEI